MLLDITVIVSLALAVTCAVHGLLAFFRETPEEQEVKDAAKEVSAAAKAAAKTTTGTGGETLGGGVTPQAAFTGASEYLKALASFAEALAKLKRDVAALVLALAFLLVATIGAGIEDKFEDKTDSSSGTTQSSGSK